MASVVHRVTVEYRRSVNTPDYNPVDWIINPDLSLLVDANGVPTVPRRYWKVVGDNVLEQTPAEKRVTDDALTVAARAAAPMFYAIRTPDGSIYHIRCDDAGNLNTVLIPPP